MMTEVTNKSWTEEQEERCYHQLSDEQHRDVSTTYVWQAQAQWQFHSRALAVSWVSQEDEEATLSEVMKLITKLNLVTEYGSICRERRWYYRECESKHSTASSPTKRDQSNEVLAKKFVEREDWAREEKKESE